MRKDTYLNVVLTVIAVLLSVDLWSRVAQHPFPSETAMAQSRSHPNRRSVSHPLSQTGVSALGTEAVDQRGKIIKQLEQIREQFSGLRGLLESGAITVKVSDGADKERRKAPVRR